MLRIGIFLDRDGTINEEVDFLQSPNELTLIPGSADAIREANKHGWKVFIATNQSGIARGLLTEDALNRINATLISELQQRNAHIDAIYYCPHHPTVGAAPYRTECDCRKPNTGMLLRAAREFDVDLSKSFVIGDRMIDVQTAINVGATSILVLTGYGREELKLCKERDVHIDYVAENLYDAIQHVKESVQREQPSTC